MAILQLIKILILFIISLIENALVYNWVIANNIPFFLYVILHSILILGLYMYLEKYDRRGIKLPLYIGLIIPGLGMIFLLFLYIGLLHIKARGDIIDDYNKYIDYIYNKITINKINFDKEINVLSAYDSLNLLDEHKKKSMIIDLISDDIGIKINILKSALNDRDPEVVHYASSILNLAEEEFEKRINILKDDFHSTGTKESLKELIVVYDEYLSSGLIEEGLLVFEQDEFLEMMDRYFKDFEVGKEILFMKVRVLIGRGKNDEARDVLELYGKGKNYEEEYFYRMEISYNLKKYDEVAIIAKTMKSSGMDIPEKYKGIVEFWA